MKSVQATYPVHDLIAERWSPRAFAEQPVPDHEIGSLLEAARWAPSCYNEQPWRFLVAKASDPVQFERFADCLLDGNSWAKRAPVLIIAVARTTFEQSEKANRHAWHDVGLAVENLVLQAEALGLATHQMAGFDADRARAAVGIPEGFEPVSMIAIGHRGEADSLPDELREREQAPRSRRPMAEFVYGARWGEAADWLERGD